MLTQTRPRRKPKPAAYKRDFRSEILAGRIVQGMSFNQKVWAVCARIPAGRVATYADIARALGSKGYRAVGNALNKNPYAPAVPCHRVIGSSGSLTGFAGGLAKKRAMLEEEGVKVGKAGVELNGMQTVELSAILKLEIRSPPPPRSGKSETKSEMGKAENSKDSRLAE